MGSLVSGGCRDLSGCGWLVLAVGLAFLGTQAKAEREEERRVRGCRIQLVTMKCACRVGQCLGDMDVGVGGIKTTCISTQ